MSRPKKTAIYVRVSTKQQDHRSQLEALRQWKNRYPGPVQSYEDKFTGKSMDRPGWNELEASMLRGEINRIVVWRLDRLGRTAKGLTALFEELQRLKVGLVSLKEGLDLSTPAGRLMANVLASVAQFETEIRGERVLAGQAAAKAAGKRWGGSKAGVRKKVTDDQIDGVRSLRADGRPISAIARTVSLSRPTIYDILGSSG